MTLVIVFFVALNLLSQAAISAGVASAIGLDATVGSNEAVDSQVQNAQNIDTGTSTGDTLFGSQNVLAAQLADVFGVIFPGLDMLDRAGTPDWIVGVVLGPLFSFLGIFYFASFVRGYSL